MKHSFTLLVAFLFMLVDTKSKAQISQINVSLFATQYPCNNPVMYNIGCSFHYFPVGTVMAIDLDFADGTNYTTSYTITNPVLDTFMTGISHTYALAGSYWPVTTVTGGGLSQVLTGLTTASGPSSVTVSAPSNCGTLSGKVYSDLNANCMADPGEQLPFKYVNLDSLGNNITYAITDANGDYTINYQFVPGATYELRYDNSGWSAPSCYTTSCPASLSYLITTPSSSNLNFGLTANSPAFDLVSNTPSMLTNTVNQQLTAGTNITMVAWYNNLLCMGQYGNLVVTLDPSLNYLSATPAPTTISGNTLTWNSLYGQPSTIFGPDFVVINANLPLTNSASVPFVIGDSINVETNYTPTSGVDADPSNNHTNNWYYIGTAYDPNDKHVFPKGKGLTGDVGFGTEFNYLINFQNTGTAPAQQIMIKDTLDASLDPSTVVLTSNSHHVSFTQTGNILNFQFPNIMLPDSAYDLERSMGFVGFKVKHKSGLAPNTMIHNKASIYFDANAPVVTANTNNRLVAPTSIVAPAFANQIKTYPNPAHDMLIISGPQSANSIEQLDLINPLGEVVYSNHSITGELKIDVSHFSKGIYLLKLVQTNQDIQNRKIIIQ